MRKLLISLAMMALVASMLLAVTQVGSLIVTVMSKEGQVLPGSSVMIKSAAMIGSRTQATGANGKTTFRNLAPGDYVVTVGMDKFQTVERSGIRIYIQKTAKIRVELELGKADEIITVVASSPIIDTSSSAVVQDFNFENSINHMPQGRHYNDLLGATGGVRDQNNPSVFGSGSYDNQYLVDGINTTDVRSQTWGEQFNVDVIQDVAVFSGGISAEYGQFQGAVMNVVTKSGANHFQGLVRLEMERRDWNDIHEVFGTASGGDGDNWDYSGGGPIWPDLIWWYVGYNEYNSTRTKQRFTNPMDLSVTQDLIRPYIGHTLLGKVTAQPTEDFRILFTYMDSPIDIENVHGYYYSQRCQTSADWHQTQGSDGTLIGNASYILSEEAFVEARYTQSRGLLTAYPQFAIPGIAVDAGMDAPHHWALDGWYWGSPWIKMYASKRNMDVYGVAYNWLLETESFGSHDIKIGFDLQDLWSVVQDNSFGGDEYIILNGQTGRAFTDWQNSGPLARYTYTNRLPGAETHQLYYSVYIQDSIEINDNMTFNFGLRVDPTTMSNNLEVEKLSYGIFDSIQPRMGLTYDFGDGLSARASFGRYYDMTTLYFLDDFNAFPTPETVMAYYWAGGAWVYDTTWQNGLAVSPHSIADDFGMQYTDDITIGLDYQLSADLAVSLTGVWRTYNDLQVREDIDENGVVNWMNVNTPDYGAKYKEYMGAVLKVTKRPTNDNLYLQATFSVEDFNGLLGARNDNASRNAYYNDAAHTDDTASDWWGDMGFETAKVRAQATYFFLNGWYVGADLLWHNNIDPTSRGTTVIDGKTYTWYNNGKSDMDRLDAYWQTDLQIGFESTIEFPFDVPLTDNDLLFGVYVQIDFADSWQGVTAVDTTEGPNLGQPSNWAPARRYTLGFRLEL